MKQIKIDKFKLVWVGVSLVGLWLGATNLVRAVEVPINALMATVAVQCENQFGSGFISKVTPAGIFVLSVGHVPTRNDGSIISQCDIGVPTDSSFKPKAWYRANLVKSIFNRVVAIK